MILIAYHFRSQYSRKKTQMCASGGHKKHWVSASTAMPGRPRNPAVRTVTALTGNSNPVKADTEFSSHRQKKPQAELMLIFQNHRIGMAIIRKRIITRNAGTKSVANFSIETSV